MVKIEQNDRIEPLLSKLFISSWSERYRDAITKLCHFLNRYVEYIFKKKQNADFEILRNQSVKQTYKETCNTAALGSTMEHITGYSASIGFTKQG